jgi:hypothetical protein
MKKSKTAFLLIFLVTVITGVSLAAQINIKFSGGLSFPQSDQINRILTDWKTWEEQNAERRPTFSFLGGDVKEFNSGFDFEGEILLSIHPRFMLSAGSGFYYGEVKPENTELFIQRPAGDFSYIHPHTLSVIPVTFSGYYLHPLFGKIKLFVRAGAGLVWAKYIERVGYKNFTVIKYTYTIDQKATARSPLFLGGGGIFFETEPGINFFVEGSYRWAKISGFRGQNLESSTSELYYLEEYDNDLDFWQAKLLISSNKPESESIRAVKKAAIDLSGFSIKLGFMIRF